MIRQDDIDIVYHLKKLTNDADVLLLSSNPSCSECYTEWADSCKKMFLQQINYRKHLAFYIHEHLFLLTTLQKTIYS